MSLKVDIISFSYATKPVLRDVRFQLPPGQHLAVLGESGCGKSTLLHLIYGLLELKKGCIEWNGKLLKGPLYKLIPGESFIKLVAQEFRLTPHTSVEENLMELVSPNRHKAELRRVEELLQLVELQDLRAAKVDLLSGGQKQRVALARSLVREPELLLLDEPFSHIDTFKKKKLRQQLYAYLKDQGISCITSTHDAEEALTYADKLLLLKDGQVVAWGDPVSLYRTPASTYVAGFFGNFSVVSDNASPSGKRILYPHQLTVSAQATNLRVTVTDAFFKGSHYLIRSSARGKYYYFTHSVALKKGKQVFLKTVLPK